MRSARSFAHIAANAAKSIAEATADKVTELYVQLGIMAQAERETRRRHRFMKRHTHFARNAAAGLNGKRAVARRLRQIAAGSLRAENGLVS